ncbi:MAG: hypothetical protein WC397_01385 [Candidatus Paceibacterota bacterium]|jgi:hypothetical protein
MNSFQDIAYQINWQAFSLSLCFLGTVILALPFLKKEENIDNDEIIEDRRVGCGDKEKYFYTKRGFLKDRKISLWGLGLLGIGFIIQLILSFL